MRISFLGLGHMGLPMAKNLLGLGHTVTVYNRTPGKAKSLVALGAMEAFSVAECVKNAEVAITMLKDDAALKEVVHGPAGLLQHLPPRSIHLCMSTIQVETSAALATAHTQASQGYVAAPVFGRAEATELRHVWFAVGGPEPQVNRCRPIFDALGRGYTRVGPNAAQAHALKLGGNLLTLAMELAVSEVLTYTKKAGIPPADYLRFLNTVVFRAHMVEGYGHAAPRPSFDPEDKTLDLAASELLLQASKDMGVAIPVTDLLSARLQAASARGWGEQDLAELSEACRLETGVDGTVVPELKPPIAVPPVVKPLERPQPIPTPTPAPKEAEAQPELKPRPVPSKAAKPAKTAAPPSGPVRLEGAPAPVPGPAPAFVPVSVSALVPASVPSPVSAPVPAKPPLAAPIAAQAPAKAEEPPLAKERSAPLQTGLITPYNAMDGQEPVTLDLEQTSHFELIKDQVWAWSQGRCYSTPWHHLNDVELAFSHVLFLLIQRRVLLRPQAVQELRPTFTGGAKAQVGDNMELDVTRAAAPRLKELLGL